LGGGSNNYFVIGKKFFFIFSKHTLSELLLQRITMFGEEGKGNMLKRLESVKDSMQFSCVMWYSFENESLEYPLRREEVCFHLSLSLCIADGANRKRLKNVH